jgi:PAS domain-containing protein
MVAIDRLCAAPAQKDDTSHASGGAVPARAQGRRGAQDTRPIPLRPGPAQKPVELILTRQLAGYVDVATLLFDAALTLVFFNAAAAELLGRSFDASGPLAASERIGTLGLGPAEADPVALAVSANTPAHTRATLRAFDGQPLDVDITVVPMRGQAGEPVGAVAYLWRVAA